MIQRKQTLHLFLSLISTAFYLYVLPYYVSVEMKGILAIEKPALLIPSILSMILTVVTIFSFKNLNRQRLLCLVNKWLILGLVAYTLYDLYQLGNQVYDSGFGVLALALSYVYVAFALSAIKKDKAKIDSIDRLR